MLRPEYVAYVCFCFLECNIFLRFSFHKALKIVCFLVFICHFIDILLTKSSNRSKITMYWEHYVSRKISIGAEKCHGVE